MVTIKKVHIPSVEEQVDILEEQLRKTVYELYKLASGKHRFIPLKGKIVVRVLPKDMITSGGILLPDTAQNKVVYESIVISVFEPWVEERQVKRNGKMETDYIHHRCPVQVGDRVAFPHYIGMPVGSYLDDKYYRIINAAEVLGVIYFDGDEDVKRILRESMVDMKSVTTSGASISRGSNPDEVAR
jgi:co-chaperonin GroES (HSP10)